jgi:hypothetical protein
MLRLSGGHRPHPAGLAQQQKVGRPAREQAVGDHAGDVVELGFQARRVEDRQSAAVDDQVAVVGLEALAQLGVPLLPKGIISWV